MRFDKVIPVDPLKPYVKHFVISESTLETTYKIFPSTTLVIGFQYQGHLASIIKDQTNRLSTAGITGLSDHGKLFKNSADIGTVLVFFTETGLAFFTSCPANELFNQSISLDSLFGRQRVSETEEKLALAQTDSERIRVVERFLLAQFKEIQRDRLVIEAVRLIYESKGSIRISELNQKLSTSPSPLEKRFRKRVGTTPKKFASIVRFNTVLNDLTSSAKSLTDICYEHNFFDQAHFINDFRQYSGETPESIRNLLR